MVCNLVYQRKRTEDSKQDPIIEGPYGDPIFDDLET